MKEFKGTPGPWEVQQVKGWGNNLCITAENEPKPIAKAIKPKRYYTNYPVRIDEDGVKWIDCSSKAAKEALNYVATNDIREEIEAKEMATMRLIAAAPDLLAALQAAWAAMDRETACGSHLDTERHMARKAIAKALGEPQ